HEGRGRETPDQVGVVDPSRIGSHTTPIDAQRRDSFLIARAGCNDRVVAAIHQPQRDGDVRQHIAPGAEGCQDDSFAPWHRTPGSRREWSAAWKSLIIPV